MIVVGGRCVASRRVVPEVLDRTPDEFRRIVLDRMLDDPFFEGTNGGLRRDVLDVLAAIGPVSMEDRTLPEGIAKFLDVRSYAVASAFGDLERHGFLLRRGRLARVMPDVLADHLLFSKAVTVRGVPTGYVDALFEAFSPSYLRNILANAAELDWRSAVTAQGTTVLGDIWQRIRSELPDLSHRRRADVLSRLQRPAQYAPREVLEILEWLVKNPDAPEDPTLASLGLGDGRERLQDSICELFRLIATHPDFARRCVDCLCSLAPADERPTNPNPAHPRRVLEDLARFDIHRPLATPQAVVDVLRELVETASPEMSLTWAAPVMNAG